PLYRSAPISGLLPRSKPAAQRRCPAIWSTLAPSRTPRLSRPDAAAHVQGASYATVLQAVVPGSDLSPPSGPPHTGAGFTVGSPLDGAVDLLKIIKANIDPTKENIFELTIRKARNGLTVLSNDATSTEKLKNAIQANTITSTNISVRIPQKRKPRLKLIGVDPDVPAADILQQLILHNPHLMADDTQCSVALSYRERSGNFTHILEVSPPVYRSVLAKGQVVLVIEDLHVSLCTFCATYGHPCRACPSSNDHEKRVCTRCTANHASEECAVRMGDAAVRCNECSKVGHDSYHPTGDASCPLLMDRGRTHAGAN
ncbi:hypothetical protein MTO96_032054, partial [Rhipicephalus appendiculatus]